MMTHADAKDVSFQQFTTTKEIVLGPFSSTWSEFGGYIIGLVVKNYVF